MNPYAPVTTGTNTTGTVAAPLWSCLDYNTNTATALDISPDTSAYTYTVTDAFKQQNATFLTSGFIISRPYTVATTSGDKNLTDGAALNLAWGYGAGSSTPTNFAVAAQRTAITSRSRTGLTTLALPAYQTGSTNAIVNFAVSMLAFVGLATFAF